MVDFLYTSFTFNPSFFRIELGFQYTNPQSDTVQMTGFWEKACYMYKIYYGKL